MISSGQLFYKEFLYIIVHFPAQSNFIRLRIAPFSVSPKRTINPKQVTI